MSWLALAIGNSRLHWAWFQDGCIRETGHSSHLDQEVTTWEDVPWICPDGLIPSNPDHPEVWIASVVPTQSALWQGFPRIRWITLADCPLQGTYPTLGIDRALALWGAGATYGWPVLVIDAGTALTFTGGNAHQGLMGGAIVPGVSLQLRSLNQQTANLPQVSLRKELPDRWGRDTETAILSGVMFGILATIDQFVTAWQTDYPNRPIILTGGDAPHLRSWLSQGYPKTAQSFTLDPHILFRGMASIVQLQS